MESRIKHAVKEKIEDNEDLTVENMFSILSLDLPDDLVHEIKYSLFVNKLQKIPKLKDKNNQGLKKISEHLEPVIYTERSYIIRQGEPLDMLFFITQGIVLTYAKNKLDQAPRNMRNRKMVCMGKSSTWAENLSNKLSSLPISPITVKVKVEVFSLKAADLPNVLANLANLPDYFCTIL